jgi:RNA polymerase-interacting CarD/CdnL/TRCF family regulator
MTEQVRVIVRKLSTAGGRHNITRDEASAMLSFIATAERAAQEQGAAIADAQAAITRATRDIQLARVERDIARAERNDLVVLLANQPQTAR